MVYSVSTRRKVAVTQGGGYAYVSTVEMRSWTFWSGEVSQLGGARLWQGWTGRRG